MKKKLRLSWTDRKMRAQAFKQRINFVHIWDLAAWKDREGKAA